MLLTENTTETDLSALLNAYRTAVEAWITAIRAEETLASSHPTVAGVDRWEHAHFAEEEARNKAKQAKKQYEDAVRRMFFSF